MKIFTKEFEDVLNNLISTAYKNEEGVKID